MFHNSVLGKMSDRIVKNVYGIFIFVFFCLNITCLSYAETFYVRPAGANYGLEDGTSFENAWSGFEDIRWGTGSENGKVDSGDTLFMCGTFKNTLVVCASGITFRGDYHNHPGIIDGQKSINHAVEAISNTELSFRSIEMKNTTGTILYLYNTHHESDPRHITIDNCDIHNANKNGISVTGDYVIINKCKIYNIGADGIYARGANFTVTNCNITNVALTKPGDCIQLSDRGANCYLADNILNNHNELAKQCIVIHGYDSGGVVERNTCSISTSTNRSHFAIQIRQKDIVIRNNSFEGGNYCGVFLFSEVYNNIFKNASSIGIRVAGPDPERGIGDVKLYHNIIDNCSTGIFHDSKTKLTIKNNIIYRCSKYGIKVNSGGIASTVADYNCFSNNGINFFGARKGLHSIDEDPKFDWSKGDYRLLEDSPCIKRGVVISGIEQKTQDAPPSIGLIMDYGEVDKLTQPVNLRIRSN